MLGLVSEPSGQRASQASSVEACHRSELVQSGFRTWDRKSQPAVMCIASGPTKRRPPATSALWSAALCVAGIGGMLGLTPQRLGEGLVIIEVALTITVILTALYAPRKFSDRAFRMLPWTTRESTLHSSAEDRRQQIESSD
jgi:hypothetical protein